ncbi:MAG TPA: adenylate/guanylate cyclase domain-containing protein [Acidimicrobiia bacterium]|nr:adenylate/guanylate cyclase domain-containing protein [Acidimicrobiia bacterium]
MRELPTGTVTFLFTDLEGSTRLWEEFPDAMQDALARHDEILRDAIAAHDGSVVKTTGDGVHAVFVDAVAAARAARDAELVLGGEPWVGVPALQVRMGLHTGPAELREGDYYGTAVNRAARLMSVAHGGQIVVSLTTEELLRDAATDDFTLLDLGEHRLRDLSRPERIFQLGAPGLPAEFAPLRSLDAFAGNLPAQVTSFVGRERELATVSGALDEARLVTITGVGGVGKTRLALQVAAELLPRYADGAWFCELAAAEDAETMVQVVASSLDVAPRPDMSLEASILDFLRGKHLLLVLDNCEHLLDAADQLAGNILRECRRVEILATSREVLSVPGEHVVGLRSMSFPIGVASAESANASEAVQLFAERAAAARTGFVVDESNAAAIVEVCRRLDGIPLAIELAAARVSSMSPAEIASLLDERFRLLRGGRRTALERHQTLRATVDWSYSLLDDAERSVFDRLGVFAGAFDAGDARGVVTGDGIEDWDVFDALASLVAKSLLLADEDGDGVTRYQMLETIRAYARERLDAEGESDWWRRRHAEHYAAFAETARALLIGPDELPWRRRLKLELDNLRAAVFWALDAASADEHELAIRIIANLATETTLDRRSDYGLWAERALPYLGDTSPGLRAAVLGAAAFAAYHRGDLAVAQARADEALRNGVPPGCPAPLMVYVAAAAIAITSGDATGGMGILSDALDDRAAAHDIYAQANLHAVRSFMSTVLGDDEQARRDADATLELSRRLGNPSHLAIALTAFGSAWRERDPERARRALEESLQWVRDGASDVNLALACQELARLRVRDRDLVGALFAIWGAVGHSHLTGDRPEIVGALLIAAAVLAAAGRDEESVTVSLGVTTGPLRELVVVETDPTYAEQVELLRDARAVLGDERYDVAAARGRAMSYEELVAYAMAELELAESELEAARA